MFAGMRSKKKSRESPGAAASACGKTDQQQQHPFSKRRDAVPELKLPSPLRYYPGTQMPLDGWFHACRLCRCWTAFSATATTGEVVPLCRRCLPTAARKGVQTAPKVSSQGPHQQQKHSSSRTSSTAGPSAATSTPAKAPAPAAAQHKSASKASDTPAKVNHPWGSSYTNLHQQQQQYQQQQQQRPAPGQAKSTHNYKAGSRVFKSSSVDMDGNYIAPSQAAAAAAAATAALASAAPPASAPAVPTAPYQQSYGRSSSSSSSIADRRSSTGDGQSYVSCYKHLGPSNMHPAGAPADAYITCLGNGSTDNGSSGGSSREQSGSDMLGAITSLLSDLYNMRFSSSASAGSRSSSRNSSSSGQELVSRSNSTDRKAAAAAAAAAATDTLRNLPI